MALATRGLVRALGLHSREARATAAAATFSRREAPLQTLNPICHPRAFFSWSGRRGGDEGDSGAKRSGTSPADASSSASASASASSKEAAAEVAAKPEVVPAGEAAVDAAAEASAEASAEESHGRKSKRGHDGAHEEPDSSAIVVSPAAGLRREGALFEPNVVALPLMRRPLFPGQQQIVHVTNRKVIKELMRMMDKGTPFFVGAFLHHGSAPTAAESGEEQVSHALSTPEDMSEADPLEVLHRVGTRARIMQAAPMPSVGKLGQVADGGMQMLLRGFDLIRLEKVLSLGPPTQVQVAKITLSAEDSDKDTLKAYINETMHTIREIMTISPQFREYADMIHQGLERLERDDPHAMAHFAASLTTATGAELMQVLEQESPSEKLRHALVLLKKELEVSQLQHKITSQIEEKVSSHQREFMLREQLKMIKKELGEDKSDGTDKLVEKFRQRLEGQVVPHEAMEAINSEFEKFANLAKESQEYQMTRNYLDWLTVLPWGTYSKDTLSLKKAKEILDRDHYGLGDVKERILELIAVGRIRGTVQGKILCFVGPPGVGKTSIGRSIAEALGREFYRFSVGGLSDVAEIKGHRRTYVGAMPGKMVQCLKKAQTANPLVLVDEVDKIGRGHQGDPASALLELLDPSQNGSFLDHYLDVPVDCSRVLFVCTANVTDSIPGPLLDRMEVIRLSGYDLQEKLKIAEDYLVPSSMRDVGLWPQLPRPEAEAAAEESAAVVEAPAASATAAAEPAAEAETPEVPADILPEGVKPTIDKSAMEALIRWYCREAGVRNLQKHVEKICRKLAAKVVEYNEALRGRASEDTEPGEVPALELTVTDEKLSDFVGKPAFISDRLYEGALPAGTVTGLAWTAMGGVVLYVEAVALPKPGGGSKGTAPGFSVTGQLGSVMKESSQIAMLVARREAAALDRSSFFEEHDIHVHCPEGATPKDGPSAGVTMTTSLLSLALEQPARADMAMTGEVSLNGKVLPVGGIKEKTIAARRAGCKAIVFPLANRRDFDELPEYLREGLEVHFASEYRDVFRVAFPGQVLPGEDAPQGGTGETA